MHIGVLGISHKSASLSLRETISKIARRSLQDLSCVIPLLTCNRTEIYFGSEDLVEMQQTLSHLLEHPHEPCLYTFFSAECFAHLAFVTSGLESAMVGETEIQRQVKNAYSQAMEQRELSSDLHFLFQKCLKIGKWARTSLPFYAKVPSLEGEIFRIIQRVGVDPTSLLFVGNSEINRKIISYFRRRGMSRITLCTRNLLAAESFALDHGISLVDWSALKEWQTFGTLICGTIHDDFVIKKTEGNIETKLIFDLSLPRNVDPALNRHPQLLLWNIDQLGNLLKMQHAGQEEAKKAVEMQAFCYHRLFLNKQKRIYACA